MLSRNLVDHSNHGQPLASGLPRIAVSRLYGRLQNQADFIVHSIHPCQSHSLALESHEMEVVNEQAL
jgi:hypothetical protein